jgi:hypothetical protein
MPSSEKMQTVSEIYSARAAVGVALIVRDASAGKCPNDRKLPKKNHKQVIEEIISGLPLDEKVKIADLKENDVELLQHVFDVYVRSRVGDDLDIDDAKDIMNRLWERLNKYLQYCSALAAIFCGSKVHIYHEFAIII